MPDPKHRTFRAAEAVAARAVDDVVLFLDFRAGELVEANPVGAQIWELLLARRTVAEIEQTLQERYPKSHDAIPHDVDAFLTDLLARGLVVPVDAPAPAAEG